MAEQTSDYNRAAIRELLLAAFTAKDLSRFLQDRPRLRPVLEQIGPRDGLEDMVEALITYCQPQALMEQLLGEVKRYNPRQYARFEPGLRGPMSAIVPAPLYNTAAIRELLLAAFTAKDLSRFLQDRPDLRPILNRIGPTFGLEDMVDEIIGYCERQMLVAELLGAVAEDNPSQYARFEPRLRAEMDLNGEPAREQRSRPGSASEQSIETGRPETPAEAGLPSLQPDPPGADVVVARSDASLLADVGSIEPEEEPPATPDPLNLAREQLQLASDAGARGDLEAASQAYANASSHFSEAGDERGMAESFEALAAVELHMGHAQIARDAFEKSRRGYAKAKDRQAMARVAWAAAMPPWR